MLRDTYPAVVHLILAKMNLRARPQVACESVMQRHIGSGQVKSDALAAIYFNEDDELTVITREGTTQLLLEFPFARRLNECVIYLDDAHTRGTDIRFPDGFRTAVLDRRSRRTV